MCLLVMMSSPYLPNCPFVILVLLYGFLNRHQVIALSFFFKKSINRQKEAKLSLFSLRFVFAEPAKGDIMYSKPSIDDSEHT